MSRGITTIAIEWGYRAEDATSAFVLDPEIKREWIWAGGPFHPRSLLVRRTGAVPENSLHPDLLPPLARLITAASERTQVWVVAHAEALIRALEDAPSCQVLRLEREQGATILPGQTALQRAAWRWPE